METDDFSFRQDRIPLQVDCLAAAVTQTEYLDGTVYQIVDQFHLHAIVASNHLGHQAVLDRKFWSVELNHRTFPIQRANQTAAVDLPPTGALQGRAGVAVEVASHQAQRSIMNRDPWAGDIGRGNKDWSVAGTRPQCEAPAIESDRRQFEGPIAKNFHTVARLQNGQRGRAMF